MATLMNDLLRGKQIGLSAPWCLEARARRGGLLPLSRVAHAARKRGSPTPFVMLTLGREPGIFAHSQGHGRFPELRFSEKRLLESPKGQKAVVEGSQLSGEG